MNKEEKASKKIHVLKKQVKKMRDNNDEINVHEMVLHNLHGSQQEQTYEIRSFCVSLIKLFGGKGFFRKF